MFKVMIMGESAIILALAGLTYIFLSNSAKTKKTLLEKLIPIGMVLMSVVVFLLSFQGVRAFLKGTF
jgi:hypothetical protein